MAGERVGERCLAGAGVTGDQRERGPAALDDPLGCLPQLAKLLTPTDERPPACRPRDRRRPPRDLLRAADRPPPRSLPWPADRSWPTGRFWAADRGRLAGGRSSVGVR
ncbi:hypothetical protein, partial [Micromonospora sp. S4605]|uniref:hypothetical protein n=1 Tax=Micromonospora sp. S4605 TaxID=1420897 RepID=UPI001E3C143C